MGRTPNSDLVCLLLLFLLVVPAFAGGDNSPVVPTGTETANPAPYTIRLFIPTRDMIHSDQINALISGPGGETIFGTSFGLSTYNGSWSTRHMTLDNISEGLMDDYITALELDRSGNLWIGYSGGLQIFNGKTFQTIRDQEILKETRIKALQRWNGDMWIATGHAGIHRYRDNNWTWYQPMTRKGPGFYEIRSMKLDELHQTLVIATEAEGLWMMQSPDKPVFTQIAPRYSTYGFLDEVRTDPRGGVYLDNATLIVHYDPEQGFRPVIRAGDLGAGEITINDMTAAPDGRLFVATDDGIYILDNGRVTGHLGRYEGLGDSPVIRTVAIDARNRIWFSSSGYVGYYADQAASLIPVEIATLTPSPVITPSPTPSPLPTTVPVTAAMTMDQSFFSQDSVLRFLNPIVDPIVKALRAAGPH